MTEYGHPTLPRHLYVIDVETSGLDVAKHEVVEVAWWNLTLDERGHFVPRHDVRQILAEGDLDALRINRYLDRIPLMPQADGATVRGLHARLTGVGGSTLIGSNPTFDAAMLMKLFRRQLPNAPVPWHHRLWDLSAYAAGVLGLDELPGLSKVCELLDVPGPDHTAEGDVTATGLCWRELHRRAGSVPT